MEILQSLLAVILVLSLLGGTLYFLRKRGVASFPGTGPAFGRQAGPRQMKVVERIPLSTQHAVHLVRVGDKLILVATAPGSCQMMDSPVQGTAGL
jgi:flagellar biogenesis protein FliO